MGRTGENLGDLQSVSDYRNGRYNLWEHLAMIRTILIGSCVSIQGTFVRQLPGGRIAVRVGQNVFAGRPVGTKAA